MKRKSFLIPLPLIFLLTFAGWTDSCDKDSPTAPVEPLSGASFRYTGPATLTEGCSYKVLGEVTGGRKPYSFSWKSPSALLTGERSGESIEIKVTFNTVADLELVMTVSDAASQSAGPVTGTIPVICGSGPASTSNSAASWESSSLTRDERLGFWSSPLNFRLLPDK